MTDNIQDLKALLELHGSLRRIGGLDLGSKTIGVAISDVGRQLATPFETVARTKFAKDAARLCAIARAQDVAAWVIGLPLNMDGSAGPRVQSTRAFVRNMIAIDATPFVFGTNDYRRRP